MHSRKQGNGLILVLLIVSAIAFGVYTVADLINSESRLNKRNEAYIAAKQAAESLIQNAIADLETRFIYSGTFTEDALSPERNPLFISSDFLNFHTDDSNKSNLVIPSVDRYTNQEQFFTEDTEIIGGRIFFDNTASGWAVEIFGKATVDHPVLGRTTAWASQILEIQSTFLFEFAIFYNLPMEIAPGPVMDVYDKVHVNGDMYVQAKGGLNFNGRVTVAGEVQHGRRSESGMSTGNGPVKFTDSEGNLINMRKSDEWPAEAKEAFAGTWLDSDAVNFSALAEQIWDGNLYDTDYGLLDQGNGIRKIDLPGLTEYVEDTNTASKKKEALNSGYTIIQPALDKIDVPPLNVDPEGYKKAKSLELAERNKFAYKAGLTIQVDESGSLSYFTYERDSYDRVVYNEDGSPRKVALTPSANVASAELFSRSNNTISSGLFDARQEKNMNLINLDVSVLNELVDDEGENEEDWGGGESSKPRNWWNGIVYVQFPQKGKRSTRPDNVNPAGASDWGVKLVNGDVIPNPNFARNKDLYGTSIATNLPMYVEGNYNSDGNLGTGSPTEPDNDTTYNQAGQETPAALAADAITFLSENWNDANSDGNLGNRVAAPTEVSAAILTGLVPSGKNGSDSYSGGVENFPRFLEDWKGKEFRMRGSIVAMFESEVATEAWGKTDVYKAPERQWGFHNEYAGGGGPRGGPFAPIFRARDLRILGQSEYQARVRDNWAATAP